MTETMETIAGGFIQDWQRAWNENADRLAEFYTTDAILVGHATVFGRDQISTLLQGILDQGWTKIEIKVAGVRQIGPVILIAADYTAIGSGENEGKTLDAKSSHVLTQQEGRWMSAMHTAT